MSPHLCFACTTIIKDKKGLEMHAAHIKYPCVLLEGVWFLSMQPKLATLHKHTLHADAITQSYIQWNLSYPGSVGPRGARNFKIARNSEHCIFVDNL